MSTLAVSESKWRVIEQRDNRVSVIKKKYIEFLDGLKSAADAAKSHSQGLGVGCAVDEHGASILSEFGVSRVILGWHAGGEGLEGAVLFVSTSRLAGKDEVIFKIFLRSGFDGAYFYDEGGEITEEGDARYFHFSVLMNVMYKQIEFSTR